MTDARRLRITVEVDDDGGPEDYDNIRSAFFSVGAEVVYEEEIPR